MKRAVFAGVALIALAGAGAVTMPRALRELGGGGPGVPVFEVERGSFVRRVHADGNLEAANATLLGPPPENRRALKIAWLAPDGIRVEAGDVVIRFDPSEMEENLRLGQHDRDSADAKINKQKAKDKGGRYGLERDSEMADLELEYAEAFQSKDAEIFSRTEIIESQIDQDLARKKQEHTSVSANVQQQLSDAELDLLSIERRKAEIKIEQAEEGLQSLSVEAPHEGIFVLKQVWGRLPEVGQTVWGGNPVAEIPKLDVMEAKVYVLEADAGGLAVGLPATLSVDAHPGQQFKATVKKVDALAQRRNRRVPVQYFGVTLELAETRPGVMKPGQRVQTVIDLEQQEDVLTVPRQAIFEKEGEKIVYRRKGTAFVPTPVEVGAASVGRVVVTEGIDDGDIVALRDPTRAVDTETQGEPTAGSSPMGVGG